VRELRRLGYDREGKKERKEEKRREVGMVERKGVVETKEERNRMGV